MTPPTPGSSDAIEQGCTCPVIDNHHGRGIEHHGEVLFFWYVAGCPVHEPAQVQAQPDEARE